MAKVLSLIACLLSFIAFSSAHGVSNLVTTWTDAASAAVRTGGFPARTYAFTHLAIYRTLTTKKLRNYRGASKRVAANYAAHFVLSSLYPGLQNSVFDASFAKEVNPLAVSEATKRQSRNLGRYHALLLLKSRIDDGSQDYFAYSPPDPATAADGEYVFTPNQTYAVFPNGGKHQPLIPSVQARFFGEGGPYKVTSEAFAGDLSEVRSLGSDRSTMRTAYQTETAQFYDLPGGTSSIHGQWFDIAHQYITTQNLNLTPLETSRIYTIVALAQFHARILIYHQKYKWNFWRPITAIRKSDALWTPLLPTAGHPEYPSGHSIVTSASAYALAATVNCTVDTIVKNFSINSDGSNFSLRYFTNLRAIVDENGESRILGGVHFRKGVEDGISLGYKVGKAVFKRFAY